MSHKHPRHRHPVPWITIAIMAAILMVFGVFFTVSGMRYVPGVGRFIESFYETARTGDYGRIYDEMCGDAFRKETSADDFKEYLTGIREEMGALEKHQRDNYQIEYRGGAVYFTVLYRTLYENGMAMDTFILKNNGNGWRLVAYDVYSDKLVPDDGDAEDEDENNDSGDE